MLRVGICNTLLRGATCISMAAARGIMGVPSAHAAWSHSHGRTPLPLQHRIGCGLSQRVGGAPTPSPHPHARLHGSVAASGGGGIRFVYEHPGRVLRLMSRQQLIAKSAKPTDVVPEVDVMVEGRPGCVGRCAHGASWAPCSAHGCRIHYTVTAMAAGARPPLTMHAYVVLHRSEELDGMLEGLGTDAGAVVRLALLAKASARPDYKLPRMASLSLVMCDDMHIRALNLQVRHARTRTHTHMLAHPRTHTRTHTHTCLLTQTRNKDAPTDVLSFEMDDELDYKVGGP
jgi:hypothetical protein